MKVYIDGKFCNERDAKISVFDHGLLYGDGIFEGIRAYNSRIFRLKEQTKRGEMAMKHNSAQWIALAAIGGLWWEGLPLARPQARSYFHWTPTIINPQRSNPINRMHLDMLPLLLIAFTGSPEKVTKGQAYFPTSNFLTFMVERFFMKLRVRTLSPMIRFRKKHSSNRFRHCRCRS